MFAAILGDNNRETEVVSPLSTMKQALKEALEESNISVSYSHLPGLINNFSMLNMSLTEM